VTNDQIQPETTRTSVSPILTIGILLTPFIFAWFTLRGGYTQKAKVISFAWMILVVVLAFLDGSKINTPVVAKERVSFSFDVSTFEDRYNAAFNTLGKDIRISLRGEVNNEDYVIKQFYSSSDSFSLSLPFDKESGMLQSITLIAAKGKTVASKIEVAFAVAATVMAIEDPYMSDANKRGKILNDLGISTGELSKHGQIAIKRNGINYSISESDVTGTWLIAEPIQ